MAVEAIARRTGRKKGQGKGLPFHSPFPLHERIKTFWSQVDKNGPNGCWMWIGWSQLKSRKGRMELRYGVFSFQGKTVLAHRFSWFITHGKMPEKPFVCHKCDNGLCVNPDHLFEGTALDNNRDTARKGRFRSYGSPKISIDTVRKIRNMYVDGCYSQPQIAEKMGLPETTIRSALCKWKSLHQYATP